MIRAMSSQGSEERVAELDGVRGSAILMVLLGHCFTPLPQTALTTVMQHFFGSLGIGVDLFFVLSGYLITGILLRARGRARYFKTFYLRRTLRIFPAYYTVLAVVFLVLPWFHPRLHDSGFADYAPAFVLYLQNWVMALQGSLPPWDGLDHMWSLAIEEQFYLLWPLVVYFSEPRLLRRISLAVFVLSGSLRLLLALHGGNWEAPYMATATRMDGLAAGAFIATLGAAEAARLRRPLLLAGVLCGLAVLALIARGTWANLARAESVFISSATVAFTALLYLIHTGELPGAVRRLLRSAWLTWLGRYSYGIYLIHFVVLVVLVLHFHDYPLGGASNLQLTLVQGAATIALTLPAAYVMFHLIEKPALALRERLEAHLAARQPKPVLANQDPAA